MEQNTEDPRAYCPLSGPTIFYAMKILAVAAVLGLATPTFPQYTLWYDTVYDQQGNPVTSFACPDLTTQGYNTFGDIPAWPFIGGAPQVQSTNSPSCGTCWELSYVNTNGITLFLYFLAIDTAPQGRFTISLDGMNYLTNNDAVALDGMPITVGQMGTDYCGGPDLKRL